MKEMCEFIVTTLFYSGSFHEMPLYDLERQIATFKAEKGIYLATYVATTHLLETGEVITYVKHEATTLQRITMIQLQ